MKKAEIRELDFILRKAFEEDAVFGDVTSSALGLQGTINAVIVSGQNCCLCGAALLPRIFEKRDKRITVKLLKKDGGTVFKGQAVCRIRGPAGSVLSAERASLNFLGFLSGIAAKTRKFMELVSERWSFPVKPVILDTRKTIPGLRYLSKYAVRCGGGENHRFNLKEIIMVKDNHLAASGLERVLKKLKGKKVIFETDSINDARRILRIRPFVLLCDNLSPRGVAAVIALKNKISPATLIEISGGIDEKSILKFSRLAVDRVSIGALTHSAVAMDFSLEVIR
ncbi:MAG: carboxylating nicotinate-nucleotide diphosphorylase [bacterium]